MRKIGIIGAMEEEVNILKGRMQEVKIRQIAGMDFHEGSLNHKPVVVVLCGFG